MEVLREKNVLVLAKKILYILISFLCKIMSVKLGDIWKNPGLCLMCSVLEMNADSNNLQIFCNLWV